MTVSSMEPSLSLLPEPVLPYHWTTCVRCGIRHVRHAEHTCPVRTRCGGCGATYPAKTLHRCRWHMEFPVLPGSLMPSELRHGSKHVSVIGGKVVIAFQRLQDPKPLSIGRFLKEDLPLYVPQAPVETRIEDATREVLEARIKRLESLLARALHHRTWSSEALLRSDIVLELGKDPTRREDA